MNRLPDLLLGLAAGLLVGLVLGVAHGSRATESRELRLARQLERRLCTVEGDLSGALLGELERCRREQGGCARQLEECSARAAGWQLTGRGKGPTPAALALRVPR